MHGFMEAAAEGDAASAGALTTEATKPTTEAATEATEAASESDAVTASPPRGDETAAWLVQAAARALVGRGAAPKRPRLDDAPLPPLAVCFDAALNAALMDVLKLTVRGSFWALGPSPTASPASLRETAATSVEGTAIQEDATPLAEWRIVGVARSLESREVVVWCVAACLGTEAEVAAAAAVVNNKRPRDGIEATVAELRAWASGQPLEAKQRFPDAASAYPYPGNGSEFAPLSVRVPEVPRGNAVVSLDEYGRVISEWPSMVAAGAALGCSAEVVKGCLRHWGMHAISGNRLHLKTGGPYPPGFDEGIAAGRSELLKTEALSSTPASAPHTNYEKRVKAALNALSPAGRKWCARKEIIDKIIELNNVPGFVPDHSCVNGFMRDLLKTGALRMEVRAGRGNSSTRATYKLVPPQEKAAVHSTPAGAKSLSNAIAKPLTSLPRQPKVSAEQAASTADLQLNSLSRARLEASSDLFFFPPTDEDPFAAEDDLPTGYREDAEEVAAALADMVEQVMLRDNMFMRYSQGPSGRGERLLKTSLKKLQDRGDFQVPPMLWAPLGPHDASETEVLLISLFVLLASEGKPEGIATFCSDARQVDEELAKWTGSGKCASGFALRKALSTTPLRPGACETISMAMKRLRRGADAKASLPIYAQCPMPATHLSKICPPTVAEIRTWLLLNDEGCYSGAQYDDEEVEEDEGEEKAPASAATGEGLMELYSSMMLTAEPQEAPAQKKDMRVRSVSRRSLAALPRIAALLEEHSCELWQLLYDHKASEKLLMQRTAWHIAQRRDTPETIARRLAVPVHQFVKQNRWLFPRLTNLNLFSGGERVYYAPDSRPLSMLARAAEEFELTDNENSSKRLKIAQISSPQAVKPHISQLSSTSSSCSPRRAPGHNIVLLDDDGEVVQEWSTQQEASEGLDVSVTYISLACRGLANTARGFRVHLKLESGKYPPCKKGVVTRQPGEVAPIPKRRPTVVVLLNDDGSVGKEWLSQTAAAADLGFSHANFIKACITGKTPTANGYRLAEKSDGPYPVVPAGVKTVPFVPRNLEDIVLLSDDGSVVREYKTFVGATRALKISLESLEHVLKGATPTAEGYRLHLKAAGPPYPPCPPGVTTTPIGKSNRQSYIGLVSCSSLGATAWQCSIRINGCSTSWGPKDLLPKEGEKKTHQMKNCEPAKKKGKSAEVKEAAAAVEPEQTSDADGSSSEEEYVDTVKAWADKDEAARAYDDVAGRHGLPTNFPVPGKAKTKALCAGCEYCAEVDASTGEVVGQRAKRPTKTLDRQAAPRGSTFVNIAGSNVATVLLDDEGRATTEFSSFNKCALALGIRADAVIDCVLGHNWTAGGYRLARKRGLGDPPYLPCPPGLETKTKF